MNDIQIFSNSEFGAVRTAEVDGQILFCGKDIAIALGYQNTKDALAKHCREDGVAFCDLTDNLGRKQNAKFISEGNVYRLIAHSSMPSAVKFESWIFDEVLPTIHKHGAYATENTIEKVLANPDFGIQLLQKLKSEQEKRKELEVKVEQDKPKVLFADSVATAQTSTLIGEFAKILKQNGVPNMGQKRLFEWLRNNGYLIKRQGSDYNMPTQRAMEQGLFEIKETVISHADGHVSISRTPKLTGKAQIYFMNKFLNSKEVNVNV